MKIFILLPLLLFLSYSNEFATQSVIQKVEQRYDRFAKNRFVALNKLLKKLENADTKTKLEKVNDFFNAVRYGDDKDLYGVTDYWATPFEFLARDKGDCEDYVIAKYFALKYLGVPTSKLYLSYVRVEGKTEAHMVLTYFETPTSEPLILDSLRKIIFPASKRGDLKPIFNFNPDLLVDGKKTAAHKKWDELMQRIKENKI